MNSRSGALVALAALSIVTISSFMACPAFSADPPVKAAVKADINQGQAIAGQVCAACHGADGNSVIPTNPIVAGQIPDYLHKQLADFKPGPDGKPVRVSPIMNAQAAQLTEEDMRNLAAYYAAQKAKLQSAHKKDLVALGEKIYRAGIADKAVPACAGCHGAAGLGVPALYPRLAGQYAEYTETQMKLWRSGERTNDPNKMMRSIAAKLSDVEIQAVSDYIAGLRKE